MFTTFCFQSQYLSMYQAEPRIHHSFTYTMWQVGMAQMKAMWTQRIALLLRRSYSHFCFWEINVDKSSLKFRWTWFIFACMCIGTYISIVFLPIQSGDGFNKVAMLLLILWLVSVGTLSKFLTVMSTTGLLLWWWYVTNSFAAALTESRFSGGEEHRKNSSKSLSAGCSIAIVHVYLKPIKQAF